MSDSLDDLSDRVRALEEQVELLCKSTGTPFKIALPDVPPEVRALIENGKRVEAVKLYRQLTGADLVAASKVIAQF